MKKYILSGALILSLGGLTAVAQTSTTPGIQNPNDPTAQSAPAPDNSQYPTDRDSSTDQQRRDQGTYNTEQDRQDQTNSDIHRDRDAERDRLPQSDQEYPQDQSGRDQQDRDHERSDRTYSDHDRDRQGVSGDYRNEIQNALTQANLNNVMVNDTGSRVELNGEVRDGRERRKAVDIAQQYANGRKVVDHIKVRGHGDDQDDRQDH